MLQRHSALEFSHISNPSEPVPFSSSGERAKHGCACACLAGAKQDAASFASYWLTDLDNGDHAQAASVYTIDGDRAQLAEQRSNLDKLASRSYEWANVTAAANDDSECKIVVEYRTEFAGKTVLEHVDVLYWRQNPVVLAYTIRGGAGLWSIHQAEIR